MGWFSVRVIPRRQRDIEPEHDPLKPASECVEYIEPAPTSHFPIQDSSVPDEDLPIISAACVHQQRMTQDLRRKRYWIVVDNIVYDCTDYLDEHPGGSTVIRSFVGEDCSWQFWRFHSAAIMKTWGRRLRVGKTKEVHVRYKEPPRFVGGSQEP
ncbi:cytochrome b5-like heme/steroid binding domain-containing protein [Aspergillus tubingensis]|uniref:Fatty acid desaturase, putative n=1 Tax=Aspergillus niger TaxID=5061 RepID=A0A117E3N3_ASPNG|nr:fatty acid desaturase [Aspergillus tubingensis]GAQ47403.1 fatty acid desaturase, putative [Aspergillus niger]GFN11415.1 fatty acid desaturase [Aspergillus tubingensis]